MPCVDLLVYFCHIGRFREIGRRTLVAGVVDLFCDMMVVFGVLRLFLCIFNFLNLLIHLFYTLFVSLALAMGDP